MRQADTMRALLTPQVLAGLVAASLLGFSASACAEKSGPGVPSGITVSHAWVRPAKAGDVSAAYMDLGNVGPDDRLTGASSEVAAHVELHETSMAGDMAHMQHLHTGLHLPSGETVALVPGGYHIMLMDLTRDLEIGQTVTLTLHFGSGAETTVPAAVGTGPPDP